jgi:acetyl esterase
MKPSDARISYDRFIKERNYPNDPVGKIEDHTIESDQGKVSIRIFWPIKKTQKKLPIFIFFHGGGFVMGSVESREPQCRKIANEVGCIVVAPRYRLAPEYKFPTAHDDAWNTVIWVLNNTSYLGGDSARISVGGDSAGGNLAAVVTQQASNNNICNFVLQILIYPWTDFYLTLNLPSYNLLDQSYFLTREQISWYQKQYIPEFKTKIDSRHSPALSKNISNPPPTLIITAEFDPLRDDGKNYGYILETAGGVVKYKCYNGMIHGFFHYGFLIDSATLALVQIIDSLKEVFAR